MTRPVGPMASRPRAGGQIIAVFAISLFAVIAMVALVIEGGNAFGQQRISQNGSDSSANAGALVIAEKLGGASRVQSQVYAAINTAATANGLSAWTAEYTDGLGAPSGVAVANDTSPIPGTARGVKVGGTRIVDTSFARILGVNTMRASADATAVAGRPAGRAWPTRMAARCCP